MPGAAAAPGEQWQFCRCELTPGNTLHCSSVCRRCHIPSGHADIRGRAAEPLLPCPARQWEQVSSHQPARHSSGKRLCRTGLCLGVCWVKYKLCGFPRTTTFVWPKSLKQTSCSQSLHPTSQPVAISSPLII